MGDRFLDHGGSTMRADIVLPGDPAAAVALFGRDLRDSLARVCEVTVRADDAVAPDRFLVSHDSATFTVVLDRWDVSMRLERRGTLLGSIPYRLMPGAAVPSSSRLRVAIAGGETNDRRLRMTAKVIAEVRQRRVDAEMLWCGAIPPDWTRGVMPDHHFGELTPDELMRLLRTSGCLLECIDDSETPTELALISAAIGTPVIAHGTSVLALRRPEAVVAVEEWSADAFVDALVRPLRLVTPHQPDLASQFLRIVESGRA